MLRKTTSKDEAYQRLIAYVLGVSYPNELFCLLEIDPQAPWHIFSSRVFYVLADAHKEEIREIEQLFRNEEWLKPHFDWGHRNKWFLGPLYCYEKKVINVSQNSGFMVIISSESHNYGSFR